MRKALALAAVFATGAFAETWSGMISYAAFGAKNKTATQADQRCAASCIKGGGKAVLVVGDKVYGIENQDAVKGHEGQKVTVSGTMNGENVHIDSVK